jgi:hypothetical protein
LTGPLICSGPKRCVATQVVSWLHINEPLRLCSAFQIPNIDSPHHTRIFLASEDAILSARANYNYLIENGMKDDKEGGGLYFAEGLAHGEVMMRQGEGMEKITKWLKGLD